MARKKVLPATASRKIFRAARIERGQEGQLPERKCLAKSNKTTKTGEMGAISAEDAK
ncbi:hypothetical protein KCP74_22250 [Salmonella enterica subsp. enterica]|nr:hypothetical protein KCP74_22250 [Salmonella enterica subsp. enterica]